VCKAHQLGQTCHLHMPGQGCEQGPQDHSRTTAITADNSKIRSQQGAIHHCTLGQQMTVMPIGVQYHLG